MNLNVQFTAVPITELPLVGAFIVFCCIQVYYYFNYFYPLSKPHPSVNPTFAAGVSVIIAAKNEEKNIQNCIHRLLQQNHKEFEIIVVNDYSSDKTLALLQELESETLLVLNNQNSPGKKAALSQGIEISKHELLLFTDADCIPASEDWISKMVQHFSSEKEIVLGFGAFRKENTLLNKLIRFEGFIGAMQYFGFAKAGKAYMGVGRNLAYRKSTFQSIGGFHDHQTILSGDDDLLVNMAATAVNVSIELDEDAHTITEAESSWKRFLFQKRRQLSAGMYYKKSDKVRLAFFGASSLLYYYLFVNLLIVSPFRLTILLVFILKQSVEYFMFKRMAKKLKVDDLLPIISFLEPLYIFSMTAVGVSTWLWKVKKWK